MQDWDEDRGLAPKVFFVAPDPAVVSEAFLETSFLLGYEAYLLADDSEAGLQHRVDVLVDTFDELLLFFTIDLAALESWTEYLGGLQERHGNRVRLGVLYDRPSSSALDARIKHLFLLEAGLCGGCVPLHASGRKNHQLLLDVLAANQAAGRRKNIRMRCHALHSIDFPTESIDAVLLDLSISHFSARFDGDPGWELGTRLTRVQLRFSGHQLLVNVLVSLKRVHEGRVIYVMLFHPEAGAGRSDQMRSLLNALIYRQFRARTEAFLEERFRLRV